MTIAGVFAAAAFAWLTVFQSALAVGAPLGHLAWGGQQRVLSTRRRMASAFSACVVAFGCVLALQSLGVVHLLPGTLAGYLHWAFACLFALSLVGNLVSKSVAERVHGVPLTAGLSISNAMLGWASA